LADVGEDRLIPRLMDETPPPTAGAMPLALSDVSLIDQSLGRSLGSVAELAREVEQVKAKEVISYF